MQKRSIEEYIREMERMRARATPPVIKTGHEQPSMLRTGHEQPSVLITGHDDPSVLEKEEETVPAVTPGDVPMTTQPGAELAEEIIDELEDERDDELEDDEIADEIEDIFEKRAEAKGERDVGVGRLIVNVTSGAGLFPVENASVIVSDAASQGGSELAAVKTDQSGKTPVIYLPAPDKDMSQQPQPDGEAAETRAQYNITVSAPGYVTALVEGISVFDDVTAIQNVDMLNVSAADGNTEPRLINEETIYRL